MKKNISELIINNLIPIKNPSNYTIKFDINITESLLESDAYFKTDDNSIKIVLITKNSEEIKDLIIQLTTFKNPEKFKSRDYKTFNSWHEYWEPRFSNCLEELQNLIFTEKVKFSSFVRNSEAVLEFILQNNFNKHFLNYLNFLKTMGWKTLFEKESKINFEMKGSYDKKMATISEKLLKDFKINLKIEDLNIISKCLLDNKSYFDEYLFSDLKYLLWSSLKNFKLEINLEEELEKKEKWKKIFEDLEKEYFNFQEKDEVQKSLKKLILSMNELEILVYVPKCGILKGKLEKTD